jgi:hypothetical protein
MGRRAQRVNANPWPKPQHENRVIEALHAPLSHGNPVWLTAAKNTKRGRNIRRAMLI